MERPSTIPDKVTIEKCPCGVCERYMLSFGMFYQGTGWNKEEAQYIADLINADKEKVQA